MGDWSQLPGCILKLVLQKLCFTDIIRAKLVCSSWFAKVDSYISLSNTHSAILMIPDESGKGFSFFCIGDKKIHKLRNMPEDLVDGSCIGCSHGWLMFVDKYMNLCLYNPFAKARELLSSLDAFPYIHKIERMNSDTYNIYHYRDEMGGEVAGEVVHHQHTAKGLQNDFVKCVLSANPLHCNKFGLLVIYTLGCNFMNSALAFYNSEDHQWTKIGVPSQLYDDITHYNGRFYALRNKETVEVWDYDGSFPMKIREINVENFHRRILGVEQSFPFSSNAQSYIVESMGDILQVVRFIANHVEHFLEGGTAVSEEEYYQLGTKRKGGIKWRRKTCMFHVFKLDFDSKNWVEVELLHGHALFLGSSQSQSFSAREMLECEENSTYFVDDDCRRRMYYGRETGIYNLKDRTTKPYLPSEFQASRSRHFWIFT